MPHYPLLSQFLAIRICQLLQLVLHRILFSPGKIGFCGLRILPYVHLGACACYAASTISTSSSEFTVLLRLLDWLAGVCGTPECSMAIRIRQLLIVWLMLCILNSTPCPALRIMEGCGWLRTRHPLVQWTNSSLYLLRLNPGDCPPSATLPSWPMMPQLLRTNHAPLSSPPHCCCTGLVGPSSCLNDFVDSTSYHALTG